MTNKLKKQIELFYQSDKELQERMRELAMLFLYGGYINVREHYHIYIRTVEFYYHEEKGSIKDEKMYHRNNYRIDGMIPYFKTLAFNSHDSGVDITFENEQKEIRAAVLIRAYEIIDVKTNNRLIWNTKNQRFQISEGLEKPNYNTQSLYLKRILNGFSSEGEPDIYWVDMPFKERIKQVDITPIRRKGLKDGRLWGFRREKDITLKSAI